MSDRIHDCAGEYSSCSGSVFVMADFRTERLGAPSQVSDTLTPEPRRESENRRRRRSAPKPPSPQPPQTQDDAADDDPLHELDELA